MNTDSKGNKLPKPKIFKSRQSAAFRQLIMQAATHVLMSDTELGYKSAVPVSSKFCAECGFRVRSKNHAQGMHHKGNER